VKNTVSCAECMEESYISTENMILDKGGVTRCSSTPKSGSVNTYEPGDILISNIRPYFKKIWCASNKGTCSTDVLVFRPLHLLCSSEYLYYVLSNDAFFNYMMATSKGTKMPRGDRDAIMNYDVDLPPLKIQKLIVDVLSPIDKKISINRLINANLLRQMESIYCNLMDFSKYNNLVETELGPMPDNWHVEQVSKYCKDMKNGATPSRSKEEYWVNGTIPWVVTGEVNDSIIIDTEEKITDLGLKNSSVKMLPVDTVVMAMYGRGTAARLAYLKIEATTNQACCGMICDTPNRSAFLYETLHQMHDYIDTLASGSVQQNLSKEIIGNLKFPCPPDDTIESLGLSGIFDVITNNDLKNKKLIELRDYLLPKLMSGEIDVSQLDLAD